MKKQIHYLLLVLAVAATTTILVLLCLAATQRLADVSSLGGEEDVTFRSSTHECRESGRVPVEDNLDLLFVVCVPNGSDIDFDAELNVHEEEN